MGVFVCQIAALELLRQTYNGEVVVRGEWPAEVRSVREEYSIEIEKGVRVKKMMIVRGGGRKRDRHNIKTIGVCEMKLKANLTVQIEGLLQGAE